jgi:hypothetical protein
MQASMRAGLVGRAEEWSWSSLRWLSAPAQSPVRLEPGTVPRGTLWVEGVDAVTAAKASGIGPPSLPISDLSRFLGAIDDSLIRLYYRATGQSPSGGHPEGLEAMFVDFFDWDDEDDLEGNTWHIIGPGEITVEDVEEVLHHYAGKVEPSRTSGNPIVFGSTLDGKHIAVVFKFEDDPELIIVRPITAYTVPERGD